MILQIAQAEGRVQARRDQAVTDGAGLAQVTNARTTKVALMQTTVKARDNEGFLYLSPNGLYYWTFSYQEDL